LRESSGIAYGVGLGGVLWTHNDGGDGPRLYALDNAGRLMGTFPVAEAANHDWEDIASAQCSVGGCIYLADTGDNEETRPLVELYRVEEPLGLEPGVALRAERFPVRLPAGPRDIEALFVLPPEQVFLVSKGRNHPVTVYRYPPPLRPAQEVTLEAVQILTDGPVLLPHQVTGASASPDGSLVVIRTYESLTFYRTGGDSLEALEGGRVSLRTLQEPQGEAVGIGFDGRIALTSEGGPWGGAASLRLLWCSVR
jgi:hypothetical protein